MFVYIIFVLSYYLHYTEPQKALQYNHACYVYGGQG